MKIQGNVFMQRLGNWLVAIGSGILSKHRTRIVTKAEFDFVNPFTMIVNFTIDNTDKYQILLQGDFKERYKEFRNGNFAIDDDAMLHIIKTHKWFKKQ